jgi:hypothetical protein
MGCVVLLFAVFSPRLALVATWLFTNRLGRAYESALVPILGFVLLPWTTLAYAWMWRSHDAVHGFEWFLVALAFLADLSAHRSSARER